jgi:crotonobetainyl-CoA:carnitine CoA-transferase CaiB-like acyl-CoA transferase
LATVKTNLYQLPSVAAKMAKALQDVNVVEFSSHHGAAYAAMLLAEQGANAIRIEPPGGSRNSGTPHYHVLNRSKRCITANPKSDRDAVYELIRQADVVISGFTPGTIRALGLDYSVLRDLNPGVIALYMPPLGSNGPEAEFDASEELVAAMGGIAGNQWARSGNPVPLTFPAVSYSAGVLGATAVAAALYARSEGAPGQWIEVSLLAGAFSLQTGGIMRHEKMTSLYHGPQDPLGPIPCYRLFEAADHRYLFVACGNSTFWNKFAMAIDRPDLVADPRFENAPWGIHKDHWQDLKDIIEPIIRTRPRDEWLSLLREADVPSAPALTRQEFIDHPQTRALGMRREIADPALGDTIQLGVPVTLNATPGEIRGPAVAAGQDGPAAALQFLTANRGPRHDPATSNDATRPKGPLSGVLVLDFCSYIAGSYGPMLLAQMGADVIKIESLEGDSFRHFGFGFLGWNQGKRGLSLDLTTSEGRDIINGLAARADIVVENLRPGRMKRYGFDYDSLAALNSRLIYMSVNAFGNHGPDYNQPGFDPLLQARSGVMAAQGGKHGHPVYLTCAICDYGAAMLSAFGCVLALAARQTSGRGGLCETSLLQAAMAFQAGEFIFYDGRPDMENGFAEYRGPSALSRCYQCRDEMWLYIDVREASHWETLSRMSGISVPYDQASSESGEGKLASMLTDYFAGLDRADATTTLRRSGIAVTAVHRFGDLFSEPQVTANDLLIELTHSQWGNLTQSGILAKFSATPGKVDGAAPLLGEHTDQILSTLLGYDAAKITDLRTLKIIRNP